MQSKNKPKNTVNFVKETNFPLNRLLNIFNKKIVNAVSHLKVLWNQ